MLTASILPDNFSFLSLEGTPFWVLILAFVAAVIIYKIVKKALKWLIILAITALLVAWVTGDMAGWNIPSIVETFQLIFNRDK